MNFIISPSLFYTLLLPTLNTMDKINHWDHRIKSLRLELLCILESIQDYEIFHPRNFSDLKAQIRQLDIFIIDLRTKSETL